MGLRSLFRRKKPTLATAGGSALATPLGSRSLSMGSRSQIEELEQVFRKFDANGDGKILASELGSIMGSLGHPETEEELAKMICEVDSDGDGFIDFGEFVELNIKGVDLDEAMENLRDAFSVYNIDGDGSITAMAAALAERIDGEMELARKVGLGARASTWAITVSAVTVRTKATTTMFANFTAAIATNPNSSFSHAFERL